MPYIKQLAVGPMRNFAYLAGAGKGKGCVIVDPGWEAAAILSAAAEDGRSVEAVFLTHGHFDHVGALKDILAGVSAPVYVHPADGRGLPGARPLEDGARLDCAGLEFEVLHTPGHTPGSVCLLAAGQLFTGDTLFLDCCGRTDLPGSDARAMHRSLRRLAVLPPQTVVWPGHDYGQRPSASLAQVIEMNPFLAAGSLAQFQRLA
ncbi:MAG: MBL fold metallo-hydrolase [Elusimicrobia bacterium]|nr:MBL fold metallo-hydrolase [Elusimicrobiota bacterium]